MMNSTWKVADDNFGPFVEPISTVSFDFTRLFEESIFSLGPSAILLLIAPLRILYLSHAPRYAAPGYLASTKLLLLATLALLQTAVLILWTLSPASQTRASIAAASLTLVATLGLAGLSYIEHVRSLRPSPLINAYLLLTLPLDFAQVRSLWLRSHPLALVAVFTASIALKGVVLVAETVEKRHLLLQPFRTIAPESTSGIYNRASFWWLNPLFLLGYKEVLSDTALLATDEGLRSERLDQRFQRLWNTRSGPARLVLPMAIVKATWLPVTAAVVPRFSTVFFRYMQPLLIKRVSKFVAQPVTQYTTNQGWGLTAAYGLVYLGLAFSQAIYYHQMYRWVTMVRGCLVSAIYNKTLTLSTTALNESAAVTLMSTDVQRICDAIVHVHEIWGSVVEIAIGIWLLTREIGLALLGPLLITIASVLATMAISTRMGSAQTIWVEAIQTRIDVTSKILESMKGVKMLGLTSVMSNILRNLRAREIVLSLKSRRLLAMSITLGNVSSALGPGIAFIVYLRKDNEANLDVGRAFAALSLISLVSTPVATLIFSLPPLLGAMGCLDRISAYLTSDTPGDHRFVLESQQRDDQSSQSVILEPSSDIQLRKLPIGPSGITNTTSMARLANAEFSWQVDGPPAIQDITFELKPGSVSMLVGAVGSGKTTLLQGILGETPASKGFVYVDSSACAFVQQSPWLQQKSVRDNILGTALFDRTWYDKVVHACALEQDVAELPQGDLSIVGSAGHSLSGGQRHRVALARAVYSRSRIMILDDTFSGLDPQTEDLVFMRLLGKRGLLREQGITVLLVTHVLHRLPFADQVLVLADGTITEQGRFAELRRRDSYLSRLTAELESKDAEKDEPEELQPGSRNQVKSHQSTDVEEAIRPLGDMQVYKHYFEAVGWMNTVGFFVMIASFAFFSRLPDLWMKFWTAAVSKHGNSVNTKYLAVFATLGVVALLCVLGVCFHVFARMAPTSASRLHSRLLQTVMSAPLTFFTSTPTGETLNRFSQDMSLIDNELPSALIQVSGPLCLGIVQAVFICLSAAYFITTLPVVFMVMYFLQKYYLRTSRQIRLLDIEAKAPLYSHFLETLQGLVTIRAFWWQANFKEQNMALLDTSQKPFYLMFCVQRWLTLVLDLIVAALAVILMVMVVKLRASLDAGFVALSLLNVMSFNNNLTAIIQMWTQLETSLGAIARLKKFDEHTPSENLPQECTPVPPNWPSQGKIEFTNFSARYADTLSNAVKDINLSLQQSSKVAIIGTSGGGKSSLVASVFRLLETSQGSIKIDDIDISILPRDAIRSCLLALPQDSFFLKGTIRENMDPMTSASNLSIETTLRKVKLWDIVSAQTHGLNTPMNPESLLSQGQQQLFCLARAIVRQMHSPSKIVVLDEPTASVDWETDELMQRVIREEFAGCTIVAVAHRLRTVMDFDVVVVMDGGEVVRVGRPRDGYKGGKGCAMT